MKSKRGWITGVAATAMIVVALLLGGSVAVKANAQQTGACKERRDKNRQLQFCARDFYCGCGNDGYLDQS